MHNFTLDEKKRYSRHFSLPEIGPDGQQQLKNSKVLCVGAGGIGSSALLYLAAAGVGTIGIIDGDNVDLSNLQRQVLYRSTDVGKLKVEVARETLLALNPNVNIKLYPLNLTMDNASAIFAEYDVIFDATDNYAARYLVNDVCCKLKKPDVFACVLKFAGQCTVFGGTDGPCYRCLFPVPPAADFIPNCAEAGVLGALPGMLGCLQGIEAIKLILKIGSPLIGRVLTLNALNMQWQEFALTRNPECDLCSRNVSLEKLSRPLAVCADVTSEISVEEFNTLRDNHADFFLLDVRDTAEYAEQNLGGYLIPLSELSERLGELDKSKKIIVHCKMGGRGDKAVKILLKNGFTNVFNLKGGLMACL